VWTSASEGFLPLTTDVIYERPVAIIRVALLEGWIAFFRWRSAGKNKDKWGTDGL